MMDITTLPDDLPVPADDGACDHLPGMSLPDIALRSTTGDDVTLASFPGRTVVFCYPRTGDGGAVPDDWDAIPGARGCSPESCGFRDLHREFQALDVGVFGLSSQTPAVEAEAHSRLELSYPLLSDHNLELTTALNLPTFSWRETTCIKRLTMFVNDGVIVHVFYPIFPPDTHAEQVLDWVKQRYA